MSNSRFDTRYQAMVHEANCIGTVILRADLLPDSAGAAFKADCAEYLESRIDLYEAGIDPRKNVEAANASARYGSSLWRMTTAMVRSEDIVKRNSGSLIVAALNDMFDAATSRRASREATIPESGLCHPGPRPASSRPDHPR